MRKAWNFTDPITGESYYLPVNPLEDGGSHGIQKSVKYESPTSTYMSSANQLMVNATVIQDAPAEMEGFSYSGTLYTKEEYDAFIYWSNKDHPWELTDDLGRTFLIYVTSFEPSRARSTRFRWKHTYNFTGIVIREIGV